MYQFRSNWIWPQTWTATDKEQPRFVYFRKSFRVSAEELVGQVRCTVDISADTRYKLLINGQLASLGPCKGDDSKWYFESVDLAPWLVAGENVISVVVLRYTLEWASGNHSVWRTSTPGLYVKGELRRSSGEILCDLSTLQGWKCLKDNAVTLLPEENQSFLQIQEVVDGRKIPWGFDRPGYDDRDWEEPTNYSTFQAARLGSPFNLLPRPIPPLYEMPRRFAGIFTMPASTISKAVWDLWLKGHHPVELPAGSHEIIEINAGELTTGYLELVVLRGSGSRIRVLTAESYARREINGHGMNEMHKGDRLDFRNGVLTGIQDDYLVVGAGKASLPERYEPFWFRTFRFIRLEIETGEEPLTLVDFRYRETGYPLDVRTAVTTSDPGLNQIWDISLRTLRRCMHETYEDCPFYEQLQYAMDTRAQILFTYAVAADDRLARKCIDEFHRSLRPDGMINCCYPSYGYNIIPGFALYYIMMIHDHMMVFGDRQLVRDYLRTTDAILDFFGRKVRPDGLMDKMGGGLLEGGPWSFIDWAANWHIGVPNAGEHGPLTVENLLYAYTLRKAAELAEFAGQAPLGAKYRERAASILHAVNQLCVADNGYYQDGPGYNADYSQHAQVWAVLSEAVQGEAARALMQRTLDDDTLSRCTVAMAFYLFRAVEKTGLYARTAELWQPWRQMLANNLTTCSETEGEVTRSDCHAWGALALYEIPQVILGVRPQAPGYTQVVICPQVGSLQSAAGQVTTTRGTISVDWQIQGDQFSLHIVLPDGIAAEIVLPDRSVHQCHDGANHLQCVIKGEI